jgi:hypothetical protein
MIKRTDNELGKTRQKTNYLARQRNDLQRAGDEISFVLD